MTTFEADDGLSSRRDLLKKAGVGAAIVWTAPVVMSATSVAAAQTAGLVFDDGKWFSANSSQDSPCGKDGESRPEWGSNGNPGEFTIKKVTGNSAHDDDVTIQVCCCVCDETSTAEITSEADGWDCVITKVYLYCDGPSDPPEVRTIATPAASVSFAGCTGCDTGSPQKIGFALSCVEV